MVSLEEQQRSMCSLDLTHDTDNHYVLSGCVVQSDKPMPLYLAIGDPVSYVSQIVRYEASMMNIIIEGTVRTGKVSRDAILLAEHQSAPLPAYLEKMLMESDNLIADVLFKTLGFSYFKFPGNYRNGAAAMRHILRRDANIELGSSYLADGSGLSRYNLMSAATLTDVMQHIALMEDPLLANSLAVAGVSGTLRNRYGLNRAPFKNNVRGKTGHLRGIYNLTGFFTAKNNQQLAFAIIVDGVNQTSQTTRGNRSVNDFYTQFFNKLNTD